MACKKCAASQVIENMLLVANFFSSLMHSNSNTQQRQHPWNLTTKQLAATWQNLE
jgi:hypothetical protein